MAPNGQPYEDTPSQVRALQNQVKQYGAEFIAAVGGASPNPGNTRIGPAPCPGKVGDLAEGGVYYVAGGWQIPLAPQRQIEILRALRDSWQAKGHKIVLYTEIENNTRARLEGEDPKTGFTFSAISTSPPTAVAIRVLTPCTRPPDGQYPGDSLTIYE